MQKMCPCIIVKKLEISFKDQNFFLYQTVCHLHGTLCHQVEKDQDFQEKFKWNKTYF